MIVGVPTSGLSLKENLRTLKKIGFKGFQLDLGSFGIKTLEKKFVPDGEDDECLKEIKDFSDEIDFPVLILHTFYPIESTEEVVMEAFKKNLEYLKILDCKYLVIHISGYCDDKNRLEQAIKCLKEAKILYESEGKEILLENDHAPSLFITTEDIQKVVDRVDLNLCFDTSHAMQSGVDLDLFWNKFKDRIKAVHFSDFKDGKPHKEIGTGILQSFECYKEIVNSDLPLVLEVGKDFKRAGSKEKGIEVWQRSFDVVSRK